MALTKVQIDGVEFSDSTDLNVDNGTLVVDSSTNRVGVGTTSPSRPLTLQSDSSTAFAIQADSDTTLRLQMGYDHTNDYARIASEDVGSDQKDIFQHALNHRWGRNNSTEYMRIDSSGRVGIGTSSPSEVLDLRSTGTTRIFFESNDGGSPEYRATVGVDSGGFKIQTRDGTYGSNTDRLTIDTSGRVGIGTTSPGTRFEVAGVDGEFIRINTTSAAGGYMAFRTNGSNIGFLGAADQLGGGTASDLNLRAQSNLSFCSGGGTERARIDSSGRLLVGTSSWSGGYTGQVIEGNSAAGDGPGVLYLARGAESPTNGQYLGEFNFSNTTGDKGASIIAMADGAWATNDYPGRLVFSTTADGASSPTERMRIGNDGTVRINTGGGSPFGASGAEFHPTGYLYTVVSSGAAAYFDRRTNDGTIVELRQDGTKEGEISVSGTTVSYTGGHLARWSQLSGGAERTDILRGSVLSNIDEMCEWGEEENEQLNRMKVSDVEGDKNVSGVFQAWDDDDDTYTNDFYCAMTGDFVIRIAQGVTVERGDLLMSAGDGTAKPQDDDIIRSKTIAKVTSTNVSCTYDDGSYCVPCVLMAC